MSFFEPLPQPDPTPEGVERVWAPPAWDRPSEGVVPELLAVNALVHEGADHAVVLSSVGAFPNGFMMNFFVLGNPRAALQPFGGLVMGHPMSGGMRQFPRAGVRYSDGRTAGREAEPSDLTKDADGIPTQPFVRMMGGGSGGTSGFATSFWVFPLPPDGPVEVFVTIPGIGLEEGRATIDGTAIREAATRARTIWA